MCLQAPPKAACTTIQFTFRAEQTATIANWFFAIVLPALRHMSGRSDVNNHRCPINIIYRGILA